MKGLLAASIVLSGAIIIGLTLMGNDALLCIWLMVGAWAGGGTALLVIAALMHFRVKIR